MAEFGGVRVLECTPLVCSRLTICFRCSSPFGHFCFHFAVQCAVQLFDCGVVFWHVRFSTLLCVSFHICVRSITSYFSRTERNRHLLLPTASFSLRVTFADSSSFFFLFWSFCLFGRVMSVYEDGSGAGPFLKWPSDHPFPALSILESIMWQPTSSSPPWLWAFVWGIVF